MLSPALKKELKKVIQQEYGKKLNDNEISEIAGSLIDYFETLIRIEDKTKNEYENSRSRDC